MRTNIIRSRRADVAFLLGGFCILLMCAVLVFPQQGRAQKLPPPSKIATPKVEVSPAKVTRGSTFNVTLDVGIMAGFHMNAHKPSEDYLIPTELTAKLPAGFKETATVYPQGIAKKLSFTDKPLLVYTGKFMVSVKLEAEANAPLGKVKLPFTLQYQACNDAVCLPPVKIPVDATVDVVPSSKTK